MSDANVAGRWVTDAGDARIVAYGYACEAPAQGDECGSDLLGCAHRLTAPFYQPNPDHDTGVLCPACALAHFGVRPPGTEKAECGHAADDAERCRCWGLRNLTTGQMCRAGGFRAHVDRTAHLWDECAIWAGSNADAIRYAAAMRRAHGDHDYEAQRHSTLTVAPKPAIDIDPGHYAGPERCHLDWCSAPTHPTFCSSNCERAHEDRIAAVARQQAFVARMRDRFVQKAGSLSGLDSEVVWANRRAAEEIETIRRTWSALRHEQPQGSWAGLP